MKIDPHCQWQSFWDFGRSWNHYGYYRLTTLILVFAASSFLRDGTGVSVDNQQKTHCSLVEFHQHATGFDVCDRTTSRPVGNAVSVETRWCTPTKPPGTDITGTAASRGIIVAVWSAEHHPVRSPICISCRHQRVAGISAVPGHRQPVLTNLITDGECRVLSPVPLTVSTLDLRIVVCNEWYNIYTVSIIVGPFVLNVDGLNNPEYAYILISVYA